VGQRKGAEVGVGEGEGERQLLAQGRGPSARMEVRIGWPQVRRWKRVLLQGVVWFWMREWRRCMVCAARWVL